MPLIRFIVASTIVVAVSFLGEARAELTSLEIHRHEPFAGGQSFGDVGPYDVLVGVARFAVDPDHPRNADVVDLKLAPRNADGKVEFASDVYLLAPRNLSKANGAILYDVNNRGHKLALRFFNHTTAHDLPTTAEHAGDGFLMRHGFIVVWSGWIAEVLPGAGRMLMEAPIALEDGKPLRGVVRYEMMTDAPTDSMPLARREGHGSYNPTERGESEGMLTYRMRPDDERVVIPREQWSLSRTPNESVAIGLPGKMQQVRLHVSGGFRPGWLYELVCEAEGSVVQGLGYAAVRDLLSFLRYDATDKNPLRGATGGHSIITRVHGFGVSQSGRFLRNFTYLNFNADEQNRKVFDGVIPHVAGAGLGFFNHRFAQPTRHNGEHIDNAFPIDYFPFAYGDDRDPHTGAVDGIVRRYAGDEAKFLPKIMHAQGTGEYWNRAGSLVHTDPLGTRDADIPTDVRIYTFGGCQHSATSYPLSRGTGDNLLNPADYNPFLRRLLLALDAWVADGAEPPPSVYPRIDRGDLVDWRREAVGFPGLPGVRYPSVIHTPRRFDYGPDFRSKGIITREPPIPMESYVVRVPRVDGDGNERGTLLPVEVAVPTATFTGWNLRRAEVGAEMQLVNLMGSYIPFSKTKAERLKSGDPRPSIEERYGTFAEYRRRVAQKADEYVRTGYLLPEDAERLVKLTERERELFAK